MKFKFIIKLTYINYVASVKYYTNSEITNKEKV